MFIINLNITDIVTFHSNEHVIVASPEGGYNLKLHITIQYILMWYMYTCDTVMYVRVVITVT